MVENPKSSNASLRFFFDDLSNWGPDCPPTACSIAFSEAYCRQITRNQYENFTVISLLLPRQLRQDFANFYAYCRWSDNLADEGESHRRSTLLNWWQQQLTLCYSGRPAHPVMVALQQTIQRHAIPPQPLLDLLGAFQQDQIKHRYATHQEVLDYCRGSANPVGRVILKMARADSDKNLALSDAICTGLQLANFCQDMARDAANDRIYAPQELWRTHQVSEAMLLHRQSTPELRALLRDWVNLTRTYFDQGQSLVQQVPRWLATDVDLFIRGGTAILNAIERQQFDVWSHRPTVSKLTQGKLLAQSIVSRWWGAVPHG